MNEQVIYWLAGLLEGEGSFQKPAPSSPNSPRITLKMVDRDVVERVVKLFGVSYMLQRNDPRTDQWNASYQVEIKGKRAVEIMRRLYPLMGNRRREQIERAIGETLSCGIRWDEAYSLYWLAGLLEGEGSFLKGPPSEPNRVRIQLQMADKDVIDRVGAMLETNTRGPYRPANDEAHWKSYYMVVKRGKKAIKLMKRLRPLMGERRRKQIDKALASYTFKEHGDNHPQAKLTADRVREIRRRIAAGEKQTHLAKEFGVDKGLIWQIKARRIWQHVT